MYVVAKKFEWNLNQEAITSMTRGYVGDTQFAALPTIEALHTMIITLVIQLVSETLYGVDRGEKKIPLILVPQQPLNNIWQCRLYYKSYGENQHLTTFCPHSHCAPLPLIYLAGMSMKKQL